MCVESWLGVWLGVRERLAETVGRQLGAAVCGGRKAAFFRERGGIHEESVVKAAGPKLEVR